MPTKAKPKPRTPTRQRLIDSAKQHFYRDGFRSAGLDAILADVGISKAAFYKHFAGKDDLMIGVLEHVDDLLEREFRRMVRDRGGPSAAGQLRALIDVVHEEVMNESFHGCIFVGVAMEFPLPHEPAHQIAARHKRAIEDFVYELAERARVEEPRAMAQELCMILEGAYVTRSVTQTTHRRSRSRAASPTRCSTGTSSPRPCARQAMECHGHAFAVRIRSRCRTTFPSLARALPSRSAASRWG